MSAHCITPLSDHVPPRIFADQASTTKNGVLIETSTGKIQKFVLRERAKESG